MERRIGTWAMEQPLDSTDTVHEILQYSSTQGLDVTDCQADALTLSLRECRQTARINETAHTGQSVVDWAWGTELDQRDERVALLRLLKHYQAMDQKELYSKVIQ